MRPHLTLHFEKLHQKKNAAKGTNSRLNHSTMERYSQAIKYSRDYKLTNRGIQKKNDRNHHLQLLKRPAAVLRVK